MRKVSRRLPRVTELAHVLIERFVEEGDYVIDATVGNGHDTAFLAKLVGAKGKVYGFDIQQSAIDSARTRLGDCQNVELIQAGHETMSLFVEREIRAVMFNLGYLPGGDKNIKTLPASTLEALDFALNKLSAPGLITIVVYPGHDGGGDEATAVDQWIDHLDPGNTSRARWTFDDADKPIPYLVTIEKTMTQQS